LTDVTIGFAAFLAFTPQPKVSLPLLNQTVIFLAWIFLDRLATEKGSWCFSWRWVKNTTDVYQKLGNVEASLKNKF